jgi:hypothetical protein
MCRILDWERSLRAAPTHIEYPSRAASKQNASRALSQRGDLFREDAEYSGARDEIRLHSATQKLSCEVRLF